MTDNLNKIIEDFSLFNDWQDKYSYIIDLGKDLQVIEPKDKVDSNRVLGCVSQVWMLSKRVNGKFYFFGDSDAFIVRGLLVIIFTAFSGKTKEEILATDFKPIFRTLGLSSHLSPSRSNGVFSTIARIKTIVCE